MILYGQARSDIWSNPVLLAKLMNAYLSDLSTRLAESLAFHANFIPSKQIGHPFALKTYIPYLAKK